MSRVHPSIMHMTYFTSFEEVSLPRASFGRQSFMSRDLNPIWWRISPDILSVYCQVSSRVWISTNEVYCFKGLVDDTFFPIIKEFNQNVFKLGKFSHFGSNSTEKNHLIFKGPKRRLKERSVNWESSLSYRCLSKIIHMLFFL